MLTIRNTCLDSIMCNLTDYTELKNSYAMAYV